MLRSGTSVERVIVAGAGPAGLSLARRLAERGLAVEVHAPNPRAPWSASFGVWKESVEEADLGDSVIARFEKPRVVTPEGRSFDLQQLYLRLDTERLQNHLISKAMEAGVRLVQKTHNQRTLTSTGTSLAVDATGVGLAAARFDAYQSAFGLWIDVPTSASLPHPMTLMDFRGSGMKTPSFLYAMRESSSEGMDRLFVQETVLASKQPYALSELRSRLHRRLESLGLSTAQTVSEERCIIPMGRDLPTSAFAVLPFGAAAGMVHPATGYQLATCLNLSHQVGEAIFESRRLGTEAAGRAALSTMWPTERRRSWELYRWSASALTEMNQREMGDFSEAFFSVSTDSWFGFMQGTLSPNQILRVLARVFLHGSTRLKLRLLRSSGGGGTSLGRILLAS